jgi:hypothetical protein
VRIDTFELSESLFGFFDAGSKPSLHHTGLLLRGFFRLRSANSEFATGRAP